MTRLEQINKGKIYSVYLDKSPEITLFEGNKTNAFKFVKEKFGMSQYKNGGVRVSKLIWEYNEKGEIIS